MQERSPRFPNKLAIIGVFFVLFGGVLLLWTAGYLHRFISLWPLVPIIVGLVLLYFRVFQSGPDYYVFIGTSLLLAGLILLLAATALQVELGRIWPLFMTVIGVAFLAYGFRKQGASRVTFTVPGGAMTILSLIFLPFSLELVRVDFSSFVAVWWPVLLVIVGLVLIFAHLGRRSG
ncbi:MAG: LiaF transmembrane domain-containing protein [Spirochaetota bacterium]